MAKCRNSRTCVIGFGWMLRFQKAGRSFHGMEGRVFLQRVLVTLSGQDRFRPVRLSGIYKIFSSIRECRFALPDTRLALARILIFLITLFREGAAATK